MAKKSTNSSAFRDAEADKNLFLCNFYCFDSSAVLMTEGTKKKSKVCAIKSVCIEI